MTMAACRARPWTGPRRKRRWAMSARATTLTGTVFEDHALQVGQGAVRNYYLSHVLLQRRKRTPVASSAYRRSYALTSWLAWRGFPVLATRRRAVEIVLHQRDLRRVGKMHVRQIPEHMGWAALRPLIPDRTSGPDECASTVEASPAPPHFEIKPRPWWCAISNQSLTTFAPVSVREREFRRETVRRSQRRQRRFRRHQPIPGDRDRAFPTDYGRRNRIKGRYRSAIDTAPPAQAPSR
jgi:hypothetical protein